VTYSVCFMIELTHVPGLINALLPIQLAAYNASRAAPACLEGTRSALLDNIAEWIKDASAKRIYWLTGVAGTDKTAVAQSVAQMAHDEDCLGATFFFSRTAETVERRRAAAVIPTIAYQFATKHSALHDAICRACSRTTLSESSTPASVARQGCQGSADCARRRPSSQTRRT
jgi:hypothetical protein